MSADLTVPPPMPEADYRAYTAGQLVEDAYGPKAITRRDAIWSERIASLLRAVPPLPVVAWSQSGGDFFTADPAEAGVWKACPVRARGGIVEYVRKADADAAIASLQARLEAAERLMQGAADWINTAPHGDNCYVSDHYEGDPGDRCNCGKEAVLDALHAAIEHMEEPQC
jgi:hypothetical protein